MKTKDIEKVKGRYNISLYDEYIILFGNRLLIFHTDGSMVANKKELRNIRKVISISKDIVLVDCGSQKAYIALSLCDGSEIWRVSHPKLDYTSRCFSISPDNTVVYDYYEFEGSKYFARIDLVAKELVVFLLEEGLRCVSDLTCDENGIPCLLEHHYEIVGEKHISANGIRYIYEDCINPGNAYHWKYKWAFDFPTISKFFLGNCETILTKDLLVYQPKNGNSYHLLGEEERAQLPKSEPFGWNITHNKQYIILIYKEMNVVIDLITKTLVARYNTDFYHGCLIGNKYWISSDDGIIIKPFPLIEDTPAKKNVFWNPNDQCKL